MKHYDIPLCRQCEQRDGFGVKSSAEGVLRPTLYFFIPCYKKQILVAKLRIIYHIHK